MSVRAWNFASGIDVQERGQIRPTGWNVCKRLKQAGGVETAGAIGSQETIGTALAQQAVGGQQLLI